MRLLIDQGNTRIKWRLHGGNSVVRGELFNDSDWGSWFALLRHYLGPTRLLEAVAIGSVAGQEFQDRFIEGFTRSFSIQPRFFSSESSRRIDGITLINSYRAPKTMGVDRWLAMVASAAEFPRRVVVIVDAGSAITVEILSHEGLHCGGYIVPGLNMMKSCLLKNTAKVLFDGAQNVIMEPGKCTDDAVNNGVVVAVLGMIERVMLNAKAAFPQQKVVQVITGGDAPRLLPFFEDAIHRPELVLDGLSIVDPVQFFDE